MLPDINFFHLTLPVVLLFVGDWMTPTPSHRAHPFHRGERGITVYLYPESILLLLRYLIWSSFHYLVLTYILVTYFSTHACLAWNQLSSSYPTSYIAVAWRLDDAHPFPGPTHSTGGRGDDGLWPWPWPWQGGWGGDPEPGTYIHRLKPYPPWREKLSKSKLDEILVGFIIHNPPYMQCPMHPIPIPHCYTAHAFTILLYAWDICGWFVLVTTFKRLTYSQL